ncbi:helix-turn-helix transcriptional regulator [Streptomyces griseiscabiei]|uniref:Helix-turn-helix domain-containing protein n=1 Tax=Streptomyces griseiscabiei TaxID=2993540 RepID=A0ABU4LEX4_9ACTN|nr:helix-turn-helix domain-containing protein [Streptomyces griseiscabiei]MBZ3907176.1 helix-turn-helix domain-containing protein [Streptomyces griseiscabiei]MDX2914324.1 helix-turn-helix domain-containing protein [Streptomyces griseiscabiei]
MALDAFDCAATYVRRICDGEQICVHMDDAQECQIKRHPDYEKFHSQAVAARAARKPSHLWGSMVAMGRMADLQGDNKWRMIVVDCLTPFLRARSQSIARDFYCDLGDVRSDMFEAALNAWEETARGVPPQEVPTLIVRAAINAAYQRANGHENESSTSDIESLLAFEEAVLDSTIKANSIVHNTNPSDPAVAEQIRGERTGALWKTYGLIEAVNRYHEDLRAGRRSGLRSIIATETMLTRTYITGRNYYYRISDFYPKFVDLPAAARALGIAKSTAYRMVRAGSFPCPAAHVGRSYQVPTKALMNSLSISDSIVHPDDVKNGADHAHGK